MWNQERPTIRHKKTAQSENIKTLDKILYVYGVSDEKRSEVLELTSELEKSIEEGDEVKIEELEEQFSEITSNEVSYVHEQMSLLNYGAQFDPLSSLFEFIRKLLGT